MYFTLMAALLSIALLGGMLVTHNIGRGLRRRRLAAGGEQVIAGVGILEGAVFALLGLLIAFTFSGAASRFDARRQLIVQEANAIGTAYLRLDLLPAAARDELRSSFREYLDTRLRVYKALPDLAAAKSELARSAELQQQIWSKAVAAASGQPTSTATLLLPALNQMFDITTTRTMAAQSHPPWVIFGFLFALGLLGAFIAGYAMGAAKRNWTHILTFAFMLAGAFYIIIDLEFPRLGFIRVDAFDQVLIDLRQSMR